MNATTVTIKIVIAIKMMIKNYSGIKPVFLFVMLILLASFYSCGGPSKQELLIGEWLVNEKKTIIVLNANGTWTIKGEDILPETPETKKEEHQPKKDADKKEEHQPKKEKESEEKKDGQTEEGKEDSSENFSGTWDVKDSALSIQADKEIPELEWKKDDKHEYEIVELTADILKLKSKEGKDTEWKKVRAEETKKAEVKEEKPVITDLEPMVINIVQALQLGKERYLCLKLEFHFKPEISEGKKTEEKKETPEKTVSKYQFLHPEIRDAIIMHLGEIQYRDVRSFDKIREIKTGLEKRIAPYFNGELVSIEITDAIITSNKESLDQFLTKYIVKPPEGKKEGGAEEKKGH